MTEKTNKHEEISGSEESGSEAAQIAQLQEKLKESQELALRLRADFENAKRNLEKDKAEAVRYSNERFIEQILHAVDNFDRAMMSVDSGVDIQKVKAGLELTRKEFHQILEKFGVQEIKSQGEMFDPHFHEAIAAVETDAMEEGRIVDEIQKGYTLYGRLLRPSRVRVAKEKS